MIARIQTEKPEIGMIPPEKTEKKTRKPSTGKRFEEAFGPVLAGAVMDFVDFTTLGWGGLLIGGVLGFWICSVYRLPMIHRILGAILCGYYCMMPFTRFLPAATLIGAYVQFRISGKQEAADK